MPAASNTEFSSVLLAEQGSTPSTPASGRKRLYFRSSDHALVTVDSVGAVSQVSGSVLLESHSASASASLDFTTAITSTYDRYLVTINSLVNATTGQNLWLRFSTNGGSSYDTSAIYAYSHSAWAGSTPATASSTAQAQIFLNYTANQVVNTTSQYALNGHFYIVDPLSTSVYTQVEGGWASYLASGSTRMTTNFQAQYDSTTAVNAFSILFASGAITSGTVRVYGIAK